MSALYLGLISGTSADAIDAALVSFEPIIQLRASLAYPYPPELREQILRLAQGDGRISLDELGELDGRIACAFAAAANELLRKANVPAGAVRAIGSHGQTLRHRPLLAQPYTLQLGDPNLIAEHTGITTVADFRRRDMAAGGHGAPLAPAFHAAMLTPSTTPRVVLNLGGIANITILPGNPLASNQHAPLLGFDTGPASCLLDAWVEQHLGQPYDSDGAFASSGKVDIELLARLKSDPYFAAPPPKSTGREVFHLTWLQSHLHGLAIAPNNVQATLLALAAETIADAIRAYAADTREVFVCGGGVHNARLLQALANSLAPVSVDSVATLGVDPDFVEAMLFAWLARERIEARPVSNIDTVTGARGPRLLGGIYS
ncbi:anhydro-N-acetylmuramic acid kinase [Pseudolysobacter antarcticus]|uniref:Anhydro-N-acetylmuramic acid kinase n=1 Tax=Pseudolysobacter antarcticus TaxID=2511995 RepID=A0A411HF98_9GAMM|nr:anhydro-N-acetylmuramic acid kinase [Pseudolysobacter antarcticus]QBB69152.1 anhydro-N-acetylmuramic acid kinase [Pseudolysobacter antarcticus]